MRRIPLDFHYRDVFEAMPDAYQTLLHDILIGDQTLFVHGDEVAQSWRVYTPLLESPPEYSPAISIAGYFSASAAASPAITRYSPAANIVLSGNSKSDHPSATKRRQHGRANRIAAR